MDKITGVKIRHHAIPPALKLAVQKGNRFHLKVFIPDGLTDKFPATPTQIALSSDAEGRAISAKILVYPDKLYQWPDKRSPNATNSNAQQCQNLTSIPISAIRIYA